MLVLEPRKAFLNGVFNLCKHFANRQKDNFIIHWAFQNNWLLFFKNINNISRYFNSFDENSMLPTIESIMIKFKITKLLYKVHKFYKTWKKPV